MLNLQFIFKNHGFPGVLKAIFNHLRLYLIIVKYNGFSSTLEAHFISGIILHIRK